MITEFHQDTPEKVKRVLSEYCHNDRRLRIFYGDKLTGRDWLEECMVMGYVGNSTGSSKIPILVHNSRSYGGGAILDQCIVKIIDIQNREVLYQHLEYNQPTLTLKSETLEGHPQYKFSVYADNELHARFETQAQAEHYILFLQGKRMRL